MKIIISLFLAITFISLTQADSLIPKNFEVLTFSSIKPNVVAFHDKEIKITVEGSASPLIYPLKKPKMFKRVSLKGKIKGKLNLPSPKKINQGDKGADDFTFRLGLVTEGKKTLNFFQRAIAPSWITKLYSLGKKARASGIKEIVFYNVVQEKSLLGKEREHPISELLKEKFIIAPNKEGEFEMTLTEKDLPDENIVALWISCDGDDTKSSYEISLSDITFVPLPSTP